MYDVESTFDTAIMIFGLQEVRRLFFFGSQLYDDLWEFLVKVVSGEVRWGPLMEMGCSADR